MKISDHLRLALQALKANKVRSALTMIGMVIGTASVVAVVSISLGGKDFVVGQIKGLGSNLIGGHWKGMISRGGQGDLVAGRASKDITLEDLDEIRQKVPSVKLVSPVMMEYTPLYYAEKERQVMVMGVSESYPAIRSMELVQGRFFNAEDDRLMRKVCLIKPALAERLFGKTEPAVGKTLKIKGLTFEIIGIYKESPLFGGPSQAIREAIMVPVRTFGYFVPIERVDMIFAEARSPQEVEKTTQAIRLILEKNHNAKGEYDITSMGSVLSVVDTVTTALTLVIGFIAAISLIVGGVGVMNIMLVSVTERTREIGIRMAVGAERKDILMQFLMEAVVLSLVGGSLGILLGAGIPLLVSFIAHFPIPISLWAVAAAFGVSFMVGIIFGIYPANKASRLDPIESLRYE